MKSTDDPPPGLPPGFETRHSWDAPIRLTLAGIGVVLVIVVLVYLIAPAMRP